MKRFLRNAALCMAGIAGFALIFGLAGCQQSSDPGGEVDTRNYSYEVDRDLIVIYLISGADYVEPDDQVIRVTNTGEGSITVTPTLGGPDASLFWIAPPSAVIEEGDHFNFTLGYMVGDPWGETYTVIVRFENNRNITPPLRVDAEYIGITFEAAEITATPMPLQVDVTSTLSTDDTMYTADMAWFSSNPARAVIDDNTVTPLTGGNVTLGFIRTTDPFVVRGQSFFIFEDYNPAVLESANVQGAVPTVLDLKFDGAVTASSAAGFSVSGSAITGISGSGTDTLTLTLAPPPAQGDTVTLDYDAELGNVARESNGQFLESFTNRAVTLNSFTSANLRPTVTNAVIMAIRGAGFDEDFAKEIMIMFNKPMTAANTNAFIITGSVTAERVVGIEQGAGDSLILTMNDWPSESEKDDFRLIYNDVIGDLKCSMGYEMAGFNMAVSLQGFDGQENTNIPVPRIISATIENATPDIVQVVFSQPVTVNHALFQVKVSNWTNVNYGSTSPPAGGTMLDVGATTRTITGASVVVDTNNRIWNLTMSAPAGYAEVLRLATTAAGGATSIGSSQQIAAIPQFIIRSLVKRQRNAFESEPGFYINGVKIETGMEYNGVDVGAIPTAGNGIWNNIVATGRPWWGGRVASDPNHPKEGDVYILVLDEDQVHGQGSIQWSQANGINLRNAEVGFTFIVTTTQQRIDEGRPVTVSITRDDSYHFAPGNNETLILENIILTRTPSTPSGTISQLIWIREGGKLVLDHGAQLSGNVSRNNDGTVRAGAILFDAAGYGSILLINDGKITNNTTHCASTHTSYPPGTIVVNGFGIIVMHDGEISNNTVHALRTGNQISPIGGAISPVNGSAARHGATNFYMSGGTISGNRILTTSGVNGNVTTSGGVIVNGTFQKVGGTIYGPEAAGALANTTALTGGNVSGGAAIVLNAANINPTSANVVIRSNTALPADTLFLDSRKASASAAAVNTVPEWAESHWDED